MKAVNKKIKDSDLEVSGGSRADRYWSREGFAELYKRFRKPQLQAPQGDAYEYLKKKNGVLAVEFGNWVPIDIRYNYLIGSIVAMHDISLVTGFKKFGFNRLSIAFGSRGSGGAPAHYEPARDTINITRYSRSAGRSGFSTDGGIGALAHEYGHFLDYFFGTKVYNNSGSRALSGGDLVRTRFTDTELAHKGLWGDFNRLLDRIINEPAGGHTEYYERVIKIGSVYWYRKNELFARCFEQYVQHALEKKGITNLLLTQNKYESRAYWSREEFKPIIPFMSRLIATMSREAKKIKL